MNYFYILFLFIFFWVFICYSSSFAVVIHVPSDQPTIGEAITVAQDGDTVLIADGTYGGPGNADNEIAGKRITVQSENGYEHTLIDCFQHSLAFYVADVPAPGITFQGLTISNSNFTPNGFGGGISLNNSASSITDCHFTSCTASNGGALYSYNSDVSIVKCDFHNNIGTEASGAILFVNGSLVIENSTFVANTCYGACGGLYTTGTNAMIRNCLFQDNSSYTGGALVVDQGAPTIIACDFINNESSMIGGGSFVYYNGNPRFLFCTFIGNESTLGGGIGFYDDTRAEVDNCLFIDNHAYNNGGGIAYRTGSGSTELLTLKHCTFVNNVADMQGGAVSNENGLAQIDNSILWNNHPDQAYADNDGITMKYSDIEGGFAGDTNIDADPLFVTGTHGDFYLSQVAAGQSANSPCVDFCPEPAIEMCFILPEEEICLSRFSTRSDDYPDVNAVDIGYHYPTTMQYTPTPTITPTGFATETPIETMTPPPESPTPTPTITPPFLGIRLSMPSHHFAPGDICYLNATIYNYDAPKNLVPVFVVLDVYGQYWFWNDWTQDIDYVRITLVTGLRQQEIIPQFNWPDTGNTEASDLVFWAAMLTDDLTEVLGGLEGLDQYTFSYGPQ